MITRYVMATFLALCISGGASFGASVMLLPGLFTPDYGGCDPRTNFSSNGLSVGSFWVVALIDGVAEAGISQFECYIEGLEELPPHWDVQVTALSSGVVTGDFAGYRFVDFGRYERGGVVNFSECQAGVTVPAGAVLELLQVHLVGVGATEDVPTNTRVRLAHAMPWESTEYVCPVLTICDSGAFTKICVTSNELVFNSEPPICPGLAVSATTWSHVKAMFR